MFLCNQLPVVNILSCCCCRLELASRPVAVQWSWSYRSIVLKAFSHTLCSSLPLSDLKIRKVDVASRSVLIPPKYRIDGRAKLDHSLLIEAVGVLEFRHVTQLLQGLQKAVEVQT